MNKSFIMQLIKGALTAFICTLIGILLFALILSAVTVSPAAVKAVNQFIKAISVFLGCMFLRGNSGWLKGMAIGIVYTALVHALFGVLCGGTEGMIPDLIFGLLIGAVSGIAAVNFRRD